MNMAPPPWAQAPSTPAASVNRWYFVAVGSTDRNSRLAPAGIHSRHRVELFVRQMSWHDGHRNGIGPRSLGQAGDQRPRTLLAGARCEHKNGDVLVLLDQV